MVAGNINPSIESNGNLQTVYYPVESLIFAEYNPRQLTKDQYKGLRDSIERFGLVDPIIVNTHKDRENIVVGGHQRIRIAQDLGIKDIPCVEVELDADREKELNVRLNRNVGEWDYDALANYFDVGELTEWGFENYELGVNNPVDVDMDELWEGMPEYKNEDLTSFQEIKIHFRNEKDIEEFCQLIGQKITEKTRSIWYPELKKEVFTDMEYKSES